MVSQDYNAGELPEVQHGMAGVPTEQSPATPMAEQRSPTMLAQEILQSSTLTPHQKAERLGQLKFQLLAAVYHGAGITE